MHKHQDRPASSRQWLRRHDILNFITTLYEGDLHAKRVLSLANATQGVLTSASLAIHAVGRGLAQAMGTLTKHGVKQVDRPLSNRGVDVWAFFAYWTPFIVAGAQARNQPRRNRHPRRSGQGADAAQGCIRREDRLEGRIGERNIGVVGVQTRRWQPRRPRPDETGEQRGATSIVEVAGEERGHVRKPCDRGAGDRLVLQPAMAPHSPSFTL